MVSPRAYLVAVLVALTLERPALPLDFNRPLAEHTVDVFSEGLPQQTIRTILQAHDGYLWIGTYEGLVRFNGMEFTVFNREKHPALPSNSIHCVFEDSRGNLWVGTHAGLARYWKGRIEPFSHNDQLPNLNALAMAEDGDGVLWIGTQAGLCRYRDGNLERLDGPSQVPAVPVRALRADTFGRIWIATDVGVYSAAQDEFRLETQDAPPEIKHARALAVTQDGVLLVGSDNGGIGRRRDGRWDVIGAKNGLGSSKIRALVMAGKSLLIGTEGAGLCAILDPLSEEPGVECVGSRNGLTSDLVRSVCLDLEGSVWLGTVNGLNVLKDQKFITLNRNHGLPGDSVRVVMEGSDGTIWMGTDGEGLASVRDGNVNVWQEKDGLASNFIRSLGEDEDGSIWVGTNRAGTSRLDLRSRRATTMAAGEFIGTSMVAAIHRARDGSLWFGGERNRVDRLKSGVWSHYPVEERGQKRLRPISVNCFFEDVRGQLWAGTSVGLARLEGSSFSVIAAPSPSPEVFGIAETGRGPLIVVGTSGAFLFYNYGLSALPRPDGYLDHTIFEVLKDETGDFWLSSNRGVLRVRQYDLETYLEGTRPEVIVEYFDIADGLLTLQCNGSTSPAAVRSRDGRLWFATNRGVSVVDPAKLHLNRLPPPVHIGRFLLDGEAVARPQEAVFPAGSRNAEIHYDALSFIAPQRVKFRYRLDGLDETWVDAGNRRVAYYNVLPPGRYTFRVIAANHDGVWNDIGDSLWFTVEPYFYQTDWFLVLVIAAIASATYSYFRYRVHRLRREAVVLEATVAERTQALREANQQMQKANAELHAANEALTDLNLEKSEFLGIAAHDLKSPLTVIRGYAEVLKSPGAPQEKREEILDRIVQAARRMTALIQNLLDVHALEIGKVEFNIEPCPAFEIVESVRASFEERALAKNQTLTIEADEGARILADKTLLSQIVENLVSNAIKYSPPGGAIRIGIRNLENAVAIEVQDQGPGLTKEDQQKLFGKFARLSARPTAGENSTGLGLSIVKRLTEAMDGRVWCESEPGKGSTFIVELPRASG